MLDSICRHARASLPPDALQQALTHLMGAQRQSLLAAVGQGERRPETEQHHHHDIPPDRESLVGHMDSQSTDVDRQALMEDVKTLSRANSGLQLSPFISIAPPSRADRGGGEVSATGRLADSPALRSRVATIRLPSPIRGMAHIPKRPSYAQEDLEAEIKRAGVVAQAGAGSSFAADLPQQPEHPLIEAEFSFQDFGHPVSSLSDAKSTALGGDAVISQTLWNMEDPFAGASQAASQTASLTHMASYDVGPDVEDTHHLCDDYDHLDHLVDWEASSRT